MTPLELLQAELDKWQRALKHLEESFSKDEIPRNVYLHRLKNLEEKISCYKYAIRVLTTYM